MSSESKNGNTTIQIKLENVNDIKNFVNIANEYAFDIVLSSGEYMVNAKSIVEVFSLELSENINLTIDASENEKYEFFEKIKKYVTKTKTTT